MRRALTLTLLVLLSCSKKNDNDFLSTAPVDNRPAAIAGDDFDVVLSAATALNGSKSFDPLGAALTFLWEQTAGPPVTLSSTTIAAPTFTAPAAVGAATFRLTVSSANGSDTDSVNVNVKTMVVTAPDTWFVGYGKTGTITATVVGGTGPFTYEWTGSEAWMPATGTTTAVLGWTTPSLTDFQNFPDRAEVAILERTTQGRLQLKIKVTDALGAVDEDFVNFSAGPFSDSVANENVARGEPAFLNGAANTTAPITSWTWTGIKPTGAAIAFFKPDKTALGGDLTQRHVYFVPDLVGPYEIILTQNPGAVVKVINITCGTYVGVGNLLGKTPDPFVGECAACHAGQLGFVADFANTWLKTGHATMYSRLLDPTNTYHAASQAKGHYNDVFNFGSNYSIDSRTVGWSAITSGGDNGGWCAKAAAEGAVFKDATWDDFKRRHPLTAARSNVQCESCHGPGSEHAGDTTGIRKSYDATNCGRCHSRKQDLWEASSHGKPPLSVSGSASCTGCHTAQGFVVEMRAQEGADPHPVLYAWSNINRPVLPAEDRRGTTCQACHDPHKRTAKMNSTGADPQLRAFGNVKFFNNAVFNAYEAAICFMCHTSRTDTTAGSGQMIARRGPHDSTAAEMVAGTNGQHFTGWSYTVSPHGIATRFIAPGRTEPRYCLSCHSDVQPGKGAVGYSAIGGHTWNMTQGSAATLYTEANYAGAVTTAATKQFTVAAGGPSFLKSVFTGDTLVITAGADLGTYTVYSVDSARQLTLTGGAASFTGGAVTAWTLTSVKKYNVASCTQCHTTAVDFKSAARADYDGDSVVEAVQDEVAGLETALQNAINAKLVSYIGAGTTLNVGSRIRYDKLGSGTLRTFPGPGVSTSDNPDLIWASMTAADQAKWEDLYRAAYNYAFVVNDHSDGIHNTGYAVNLLQSAIKQVTGASIGAPFVPFP